MGSFIPDIEVPILWVFDRGVPDHLILHSLLGLLTLGMLLSVLITHYLYPPLVANIFRVERLGLNKACSLGTALYLSCLVGLLGHLALDLPMHWFNPVLWPWIDPYTIVGILVLLLAPEGDLQAGFALANSLVSSVMLVALLGIAWKCRHSLWTNMLLGESSASSNEPIQ
ncbi:MAG: hypothetical protein C4K49_09610 [Candidatus Thorarchaeota archaeon]|nr:MAG: hypothetical protein C4K49_09610 [Candidatus Thorarchaeota archaeon]